MMVRKGLLVPAFALGAILMTSQASASVIISSSTPIDVSGTSTGSGAAAPYSYTFTYTAFGSFFGYGTPANPAPPTFLGQTPDYSILPVAEPGTWAMLIAGFGIVGLAMRRRVKSIHFA
jgi:hypothetical protein